MSSLYPRGKKIWISYVDRFGRRKRQATGFALERFDRRGGRILWPSQIQEWQREFDRRLVYNKWDFSPEQEKGHPLSLVLSEYLANEGGTRKPRTKYSYEFAWMRLIEHFGDVPVQQLGEEDVIAFRQWILNRGTTAHTASRILRSVAAIFSWAEAKQIIRRNPVTRFHAIRAKGKAIQIFTQEELTRILGAADPAARNQFRFLLLTGFRLQESCDLEWKNVDLKGKVIRVYNTKEDRWEYFPMDPVLQRFLRDLPREHDPCVFIYRKIHSASQRFRRIRDKLKISRDLHLHTLRANFISNLVNSGLSESQVMQLARHRSLATTHKFYTAFDQRRLREALQRSRQQPPRRRA